MRRLYQKLTVFLKRSKNVKPHNWLIHYYLWRNLKKNSSCIRGKVLDVGCGKKPFGNLLRQLSDLYIGIDLPKAVHQQCEIDIFGNGKALPVKNGCIDTVLSFQVLEHIDEPTLFIREIYRVLKPGGKAIITTPFMWGLHEEPYDYYRFTRYGLEYLSSSVGFEVIKIIPDSGFWSMAMVRLNYRFLRFCKGPLKLFWYPIFFTDQVVAYILDIIFKSETDTATYTTILVKPGMD